MPDSNDTNGAPPLGEAQARLEQLESELIIARNAAARAEREQGRLQGELTKTTELWVAACHAQQQWDVLFSENVEALRLANEQLAAARRSYSDIQQSTSWRVLQAGLAPYRWVRGIR